MRHPRLLLVLLAALAMGTGAEEAAAQLCEHPCVGPPRGALVAAGGGDLSLEIYRRFVQLAGGSQARIVIIPTAGAQEGSHDAWTAIEQLKKAGVRRFEILHTRSRGVANMDAFVAPLFEATGVWISGGRQWRLVDVYLGTRTHLELTALLARGGVIGGNSAGASVLASFLIRGAVEDNVTVVAPGRDEGFGFLRGVAIDQHVLARGRENDLLEVLDARPELLGIGLDEGAALVITGDLAEVMGESMVAVYDSTDPLHLIPLRWLRPGDVYDLGARRVLLAAQRDVPGR
jgi:cyanophycinase